MGNYLLRRIFQMVPVLFIISFIVFLLVNVAGDPTTSMLSPNASTEERQILRNALGLNRPLYVQYFDFLRKAVKGNFGESYRYKMPAMGLALDRVPASLQLAITALLISIVFAIPLGILSAQFANSPFDIAISGVSVLGRAMPNFWVGIMLILFFAVQLRIFPVSGRGGPANIILPAVTLALQSAAQIIPLVRSNMLNIMHEDYIRTARSKGLRELRIIATHALKNVLVPVVTIVALEIPTLIGHSLITETVFAWPGLGQFLVQGISNRDTAVVESCIMMIACMTLVCNLFADLVYCLVDPRIGYVKEGS
jgi:peptide/nickel transport system permease protein